jgi:hypothetical protein
MDFPARHSQVPPQPQWRILNDHTAVWFPRNRRALVHIRMRLPTINIWLSIRHILHKLRPPHKQPHRSGTHTSLHKILSHNQPPLQPRPMVSVLDISNQYNHHHHHLNNNNHSNKMHMLQTPQPVDTEALLTKTPQGSWAPVVRLLSMRHTILEQVWVRRI